MDINKKDLEQIAGALGELDGKSEDETVNELANIIRSGQSGISPNKAKKMIQTILPMVDQGQRRKLQKLLEALEG